MDNGIDGFHVSKLGIPVQYVALVDYANSRGAVDMGILPGDGGLQKSPEMLAAEIWTCCGWSARIRWRWR